MNRSDATVVASIVDKIEKIENVIFKLESIKDKKSYIIASSDEDEINIKDIKLEDCLVLNLNNISTEIFKQSVLEFLIDTLNLELKDLIEELDKI